MPYIKLNHISAIVVLFVQNMTIKPISEVCDKLAKIASKSLKFQFNYSFSTFVILNFMMINEIDVNIF